MVDWVSRGFELGSRQSLTTASEMEAKWLSRWKQDRIFEADPEDGKPKFFICVPYSYQNGPLHLGHGFTFTRGDAIARFKRMKGFNVLFPWAWHWTGEAVAGTSERLKRGDEKIIRMLRDIDKVPEDLIPLFTNPAFICAYYTAENRQVVDLMGWSVDWRREFYTTDLHPYYSKFITWQYETLLKGGFLNKGKHPVVWCPACRSATGDHDRLSGEGVYPEEFTLVLFDAGEYYLAAATLRPETIFGATNVWVNPEAEYVVAEIDGKSLLVSRKAAEKLKEQSRNIVIRRALKGEELVGLKCKTPLTEREVLILPAGFVDPDIGTGVVYSVPSHAPYDYAALKELWQKPEQLKQYRITPEQVKEIKPISIIQLEGFGEHPAVDIVEKLNIGSQHDREKLDEATKEIYSQEFHRGVMKQNCGEFSGMRVSEARDKVREHLLNIGMADTMYDLPEPVICRSGDACIVKIVEDQWFLSYSSEEWKEKVRKLIRGMNIHPEEARQWFLNIVDWLRDWACTRKTGLGTPLPWDKSWIVETLSDSTVYPALYTVSKYLNSDPELRERVNSEALSYIFRGEGNLEELAEQTGIDAAKLKKLREEFLYWYPVDLRISAKELVPNHLTFYLFHHTALFDESKWPAGVGVNGMIKIEGMKMAKSLGNFIPLKVAVARYGADATRCTLLLGAEDLDDPDWRGKVAENVKNDLQNFLRIVENVVSSNLENDETDVDKWLKSATIIKVIKITAALEKLKTRAACAEALYGMLNNWRWYVRRTGGRFSKAAREVVETWVKLLAPFAPYTAEEAWSMLGNRGYVSLASWPVVKTDDVDPLSIVKEENIRRTLEDIHEIIKVTKRKPHKATLYVSADWKRQLAYEIVKILSENPHVRGGEIIKATVNKFPDRKKELPNIAPKITDIVRENLERVSMLLREVGSQANPYDVMLELLKQDGEVTKETAELLSKEADIQVDIIREETVSEDPMGKARSSLPLKPGIYLG